MTERTKQPVKETPPANNHRSNNYPRNNHHSNDIQDISIWDSVVRLCHWGLVICFITNYFIVEPGRLYHEIAGYSAAFLIVVRIVWGFTRPLAKSTSQDRHASHDGHNRGSHNGTSYDCHNKSDNKDQSVYQVSTFCDRHSSDVYDRHNSNGHNSNAMPVQTGHTNNEGVCESSYASFRTVNLSSQAFKEHLQHLKLRNVPVQTGHNPFGWLMIFTVIGLFFGLGITGFLMEEVDALFGNSTLEWVHSILADVLYACVLVHIAAVFFVQYRGRVQLLRPMITGLRRNLSQNDNP